MHKITMILFISILSSSTIQHANTPSRDESFFQIIYHWFTGNHKHYERRSESATNISADDIFNQFRHDKRQEIPSQNIEAIINIARPEINNSTAFYKNDYIIQLLYSAIITEHSNKVRLYLHERSNQLRPVGITLNPQVAKDILEAEENNIRVCIEKGDPLHTFYKQYYKTRIDERLSNPTYAQQTFKPPYRS